MKRSHRTHKTSIKTIFPLAATLLTSIVSLPATAGNFSNSIGAGVQYGGVVGWQGAYSFGNNQVRAGFGFFGVTYGYDRYIGENVALGVQGFGNHVKTGAALNFNYYFNGVRQSGWMLGLDYYEGFDTGDFAIDLFFEILTDPMDIDVEQNRGNGFFVSVGYRF